MTNAEAIETLRANYPDACYEQLREAVDAAIEVLKAQDAAGDTISRQAAIDALDFEIVHMTAYCDGKNEGNPLAQYNKGLEDGKKAIEALPSAQPEQIWILCDERMPEEHEWIGTKKFGTTMSDEVYVTFENSKGERFTKHLHFHNGELSRYDKAHMDAWFKDYKPIAWMPLPEPYKPKERKDGEANAEYRD